MAVWFSSKWRNLVAEDVIEARILHWNISPEESSYIEICLIFVSFIYEFLSDRYLTIELHHFLVDPLWSSLTNFTCCREDSSNVSPSATGKMDVFQMCDTHLWINSING